VLNSEENVPGYPTSCKVGAKKDTQQGTDSEIKRQVKINVTRSTCLSKGLQGSIKGEPATTAFL